MKIGAFFLTLLLFSSCYSTKIKFNNDPGIIHQEYDKKFHYSYFGISFKEVELDKICPDGVAWIYQEHSFLNGAIRLLSLGIISANEVTVYCSSKLTDEVSIRTGSSKHAK